MRYYNYTELDESDLRQLVERPKIDFKKIFSRIQPIINEVKERGDGAVQKYNQQFDGLQPDPLTAPPQPGTKKVDADIREAVDTAYDNIARFHEAQRPDPLRVQTMEGIECSQEARPIERVGLYVPGGTAVLPSTALMLGVPARLAGCKKIVLATPPRKDETLSPVTEYIARKLEIDLMLRAGGAQAIAAMAYGTETVPKVDKIFGPGNQYVTAAKMYLQNSDAQISMDLPAGPSEVLIIADESARPAFVASDLLAQAEHGEDSQVVLVHTPDFNLEELKKELDRQLESLPRKEAASGAITNSFAVEVADPEQALEFSNRYAPEHLIIQCRKPKSYTPLVQNAGSVFLGPWSPESAGDYASGTNHTLPTYGYARMYSGVSLLSFMKQITFQHLTREGLGKLGDTVMTLADVEELEAHKRSISIRLDE